MKLEKLSKVLAVILICIIVIGQQESKVFADENKNSKTIEEVVDEFMDTALENYSVPGAAVSVVQGEEVVLSKGYGVTDIKAQKPVDMKNDLFYICSITKTFTSMAVLKLVDEGLLDLDEDIMTYIPDVSIENTFNVPITLRMLLSHSSGLVIPEESAVPYVVYGDLDKEDSLKNLINLCHAKTLRCPGEEYQYCNVNMGLAGYIVETVTGRTMRDYVENEIFPELGITNSVYKPTNADKERMVTGYELKSDKLEQQEPENILMHSAGSICLTGQDMSHFLMNYMKDTPYLAEAKKVQMRVQEDMPGCGLGLFENYRNTEIMMHDGDTECAAAGSPMIHKRK